MKQCVRLVSVLLAGLLLLGTTPDQNSPLQGFRADSSRSERDWEQKFKAIPTQQNLKDYMQRLAAHPHHVGSRYDKDNAEWLVAKFTIKILRKQWQIY